MSVTRTKQTLSVRGSWQDATSLGENDRSVHVERHSGSLRHADNADNADHADHAALGRMCGSSDTTRSFATSTSALPCGTRPRVPLWLHAQQALGHDPQASPPAPLRRHKGAGTSPRTDGHFLRALPPLCRHKGPPLPPAPTPRVRGRSRPLSHRRAPPPPLRREHQAHQERPSTFSPRPWPGPRVRQARRETPSRSSAPGPLPPRPPPAPPAQPRKNGTGGHRPAAGHPTRRLPGLRARRPRSMAGQSCGPSHPRLRAHPSSRP